MKLKSALLSTINYKLLTTNNGLTLIELLIAIAVLGVLAATVVAAINPLGYIARAKDSEKKTNVSNLFKALKSALVLQGQGSYNDADNTWISSLVTDGELKNNPSDTNTIVPCSQAAGETAGIENGYCYKTDGTKAVVYTALESEKELESCTGECDIAYYVLSSETSTPQVLFGSNDVQPSSSGTVGDIYHTYNEGLVGHWPFNASAAANDIIGGNNGVLQCNGAGCSPPSLTTGRNNNPLEAYELILGTRDWIEISNLSSYFTGTNPWTMAFWVYTNGYTNKGSIYNSIAFWGRVDAASPPGTGFYLINTNLARLFRNNGTVTSATSSVSINGAWHHVVGIYNGSTIEIFIDGVLVSGSASSTQSIAGTSLFYLGRDSSGMGRLFDGKVDDLRIWNRALTPSEISDLADS